MNDTTGGLEPFACVGPLRRELRNDGDVSFTVSVRVGGQDIDVIPDTGSYELVVFADSCEGCGKKGHLYQESQTGTFRQGLLEAKQSYGSGSTQSREAYDSVALGCLDVESQVFWEVYQANMPIIEQGSFQGIFGLGPPADNPVMAREELQHVKEELHQMESDGMDISAYDDVVENLQAVADFTVNASLWLTALRVRSYSICIRPAHGSPGVFVFNDDSVERYPKNFVSVPVVGDKYWSAKLGGVRFGDGGEVVDCADRGCDAILDSGTSLIAAPPQVVDHVVTLMQNYSEISRNCKDLTQLPDLVFELGGETFSLPPESYMGEIQNDDYEWIRQHMPHLARQIEQIKSDDEESQGDHEEIWCSPLLMSLDQDPKGPREWILGLPFYRRYYTNFRLSDDSKEAASVHFARPDDECQVGVENTMRVPTSFGLGRTPLRVSASKLRAPRRGHNKRLS